VNLLTCCCQGGCQLSYSVPGFDNVTTVTDYADPPGSNIAPYARVENELDGAGGCVPPSTGCGPGQQVCYPSGFDRSADKYGGISTPGTAVNHNGYQASGSNVTISNPCYGWKAVAVEVHWPGVWGFIYSGPACCASAGQDQTKYTSITSETHARYFLRIEHVGPSCYDEDPGWYFETELIVEAYQVASVDEFGNLTRSGSVSVYQETRGTYQNSTDIDSCDLDDNPGAWGGLLPVGDVPLSARCGIIGFGHPAPTTGNKVAPVTGTKAELNALELFAPPASQAESGDPCEPGYQPEIVVTGNPAVFDLTDTTVSVDWDQSIVTTTNNCCANANSSSDFYPTVIQTQEVEFSKTVTLGGGIAYSAIQAEAIELLDLWSLNDDQVYPYRTDAATWLVPLVSRDAAATAPSIDWTIVGGDPVDCSFLSSSPYSGEVRGAPNPSGYARHYNFDHINWEADANGDGSFCGACNISRGAASVAPLTPAATQWTDKKQGIHTHGPGAWLTNAFTGEFGATGAPANYVGDVVWAQKWAETILPWPGLSYSRPCGRDRYLFDEQAIACVVDFTPPNLEIEAAPLSGPTTFAIGDMIAIATGVYQVTGKADDQNYTVGSKLYDLLIPCDGASKLRFSSARALCSKRSVVSATQSGGNVAITLAEDHWFKRNGSQSDTVDFEGVAGLGNGLTVTVTGAKTFTVPGTLSGPYTSGGFVKSTGAPASAETWDTDCTRKTFVTREWQSNFRTYAEEYETNPEVLPYSLVTDQHQYSSTSLANPYVVVISPNAGDTPTNGVRYDFGSIAHDQCYGEGWHMDVVQAVPDPFWQHEHIPCGHGANPWSQATEPCAEVPGETYAYPPLVEARKYAPYGAPALPDGIAMQIDAGIPGQVSHPQCSMEPYNRGTVHAIRAAWETCYDLTLTDCPADPTLYTIEPDVQTTDTTVTTGD
jgi:hypothetical protein